MRLTASLTLLTILPLLNLSAADPDPFLGKWKLNWDKSHSSEPQPKSAIRTYRSAKNGVRVSEVQVDQSGKRAKLDYIAAYDGKEYPIPTAKDMTVAFTRPEPHTVVGSAKRNGRVAYLFKRVVSSDGKTLTIEFADAPGATPARVLVYDKVK